MKFSFLATLESFESPVYQRHFIVPEEIAEKFLAEEQTRVICQINNQLSFHAGLVPYNGLRFILMNKGNCKKLGLELGDRFEVCLEADNSEYGMPLPEELDFLFSEEPLFKKYFHNLTAGKQRNLLYIVNKLKNPQSRVNKAMAICDHLIEAEGQLDFKALNEKIKDYNQNKRS
ncbi:MAG: YdeI/OmpD-associated family protein [Luteibaculum sp.]